MPAESLIVALGEQRYRVIRPWGRPPANTGFDLPSQLGVDAAGCVYVFQRSGVPVIVLDPEGNYLRSWGVGVMADPHGIYVSPSGTVFCIDRDAHQVIAFDLEGREKFRIGERHAPRHGAPFNHPTDIAEAPDGELFVSDGYGNSNIHRFGPDGTWRMSWGTPGAEPGQFSTPHGVWVLSDGRVLAADRENNRIQVFTADGRLLDVWGDFYHPMDVFADAQDRVYVTDQIPRLTRLSPGGALTGRCRPVLNGGHGLCGDAAGNLFLAEMIPPRVTKLELIA